MKINNIDFTDINGALYRPHKSDFLTGIFIDTKGSCGRVRNRRKPSVAPFIDNTSEFRDTQSRHTENNNNTLYLKQKVEV